MKPNNRTEFVALVARVLLGMWFVYTGGLKVFVTGLDDFTTSIANYKMVGPPLDVVIAFTVPWMEIIAGLLLMLGWLRRGVILAMFGLVAAFSFSIGWAWWHQLDISCGCLGSDEPIRYWAKAVEFSLYFVLLAWLWWVELRVIRSAREEKV